MTYSKTTWKDRVVQKPLTYTLQSNGDGTTTLVPAEGTIVEPGTAITAATMNKLETQYDEAVNYVNAAPTWTNITLQNGAQVYATGTDPKFCKVGNTVHIKGAIKNITTFPATVGTLPAGFRPVGSSHPYAQTTSMDAGNVATTARWQISTTGEIILDGKSGSAAVAATWFPLNTSFIVG